jgi:hypothetical protein
VSYDSNVPTITAKMRRARAAGLTAAGQVVVDAVKEAIRGGFTSGDFDTGESVDNVKTTAVIDSADGAHIRIGTELVYNLVWELGHFNIYSRQFERKEVWLPTLHATRAQQLDAYQRAFKAEMAT